MRLDRNDSLVLVAAQTEAAALAASPGEHLAVAADCHDVLRPRRDRHHVHAARDAVTGATTTAYTKSETLCSSKMRSNASLRAATSTSPRDTDLSRSSMSLGLDVEHQSPWPRQPDVPSPHVITMPLSLEKTV